MIDSRDKLVDDLWVQLMVSYQARSETLTGDRLKNAARILREGAERLADAMLEVQDEAEKVDNAD